jgi:hypothetical protein
MRCAGTVAAATYNVWRDRNDQPLTGDDFVPQERPSEEEVERQAIAFFENLADRSARERSFLEARERERLLTN